MKQITAIDKQFETRKATDPAPVLHGYANARDRNLDLMILGEFGLFPDEVPAIIDSLRKHGIEQVAVTDSSSALMGIMWEFRKAGATFKMEMIDTGETDNRYAQRFFPGFIITLN